MDEQTEKTGTPEAPHGYGPDGAPLAPFGYKADGTPRKDGRGRPVGSGAKTAPGPKKKGPRRPAAPSAKDVAAKQRAALLGLADMVLTPVAGAAATPVVRARLGERHAMALSGDVVILQSATPQIVDQVVALAEQRPGMLAWLDTLENQAPVMGLVMTGLQVAKAIVQNHMQPDARLAAAGQTLVRVRAAQIAEEIERQARDLGVDVPMGEAAAA